MIFQLFQSLIIIVAHHTELSMEVAQLGIILMQTLVESYHMKRLTKDSRLDECELAVSPLCINDIGRLCRAIT